jgi:DNA-binding PadR family transcriptional regulator
VAPAADSERGRRPGTSPSELELVVLGIVWKRGPCTPYAVRKEFASSPTPHFRGHVGSIYPLMRRLEGRRLLRSRAAHQGQRASRRYEVTDAGLAALRRWLSPPLEETATATTYDPLRARVYFLAALPPGRRQALLLDAETKLREQIPVLVADDQRYRKSGDLFSQLASRGMMHALRARIAWIGEMRRALG